VLRKAKRKVNSALNASPVPLGRIIISVTSDVMLNFF
jgi:hypothetical protein